MNKIVNFFILNKEIFIAIISYILGFFSKFIYEYIKIYFKGKEKKIEYDKKIFNKIKEELLPYNGSIGFLREFSFGESYEHKSLENFFIVTDVESKNNNYIFFDKQMNKKREILFNKIGDFVRDFIKEVYPERGGSFRVPKKFIESELTQEYHNIINRLDKKGKEILKDYDAFIDMGRKKYKI